MIPFVPLMRRSLGAVLAGLLLATQAVPQTAPRPAARPAPRLEAVAETSLLMEGIAHANFRGLERQLKEKPASAEAWTFARGQALLIAEAGNLLMLRPPRSGGQDVWVERAAELRESARGLARAAASRDYAGCRAGMTQLANTCNRCHQTFRVPMRITPFADDGAKPQAAAHLLDRRSPRP